MTRRLGAFPHLGPDILLKPCPSDQFHAPASALNGKCQRGACVRKIRANGPCQPVPYVILGKHHMGYAVIYIRTMPFQPEKGTYHHAGPGLIEQFCFQKVPGQFFYQGRLFCRALVHPYDGRHDRFIVPVKCHQSVHLAGKPDAVQFLRSYAGLFHGFPDGHYRAVPPHLRLLLRIGHLRGHHIISPAAYRQCPAVRVHDQYLDA